MQSAMLTSWSQPHCSCRYLQTGNAAVVIHTLINPGGELSAQLGGAMAPSPAMGAQMATGPQMSMGAGYAMSG